MNLTWDTSWQGMALINDMLLPNTYHASISFQFNTPERDKQLVAFDRMEYLFSQVLSGSIIADVSNPLVSVLENTLDTMINTLPTDPLDETIASVLLSKLIAITEDHILFDGISLSSSLGDHIVNSVSIEDLPAYTFLYNNALTAHKKDYISWWHRSGIDPSDIMSEKDNVISIVSLKEDWDTVELGWVSSEEVVDEATEIKEPAKVINMHGWKPKIIAGGRDGTRPMGPTSTL